MAKVIALSARRAPQQLHHVEVLRAMIVAGCALALILAKAPLPL